MEEIAILELKQKRLITMLSQIDPVIYLQKLQQELSALQVLKIDNNVKIETVLIWKLTLIPIFMFYLICIKFLQPAGD